MLTVDGLVLGGWSVSVMLVLVGWSATCMAVF